MEDRILCFEPVWAPDARTLILGTMPSVESLRQGFYYSHPRNAFWPIMAWLLGSAVPGTVAEKKRLLTDNGIALWDVARSCVREGSLDSAIREAKPNDFEMLYKVCTRLDRLIFNGKTAAAMYRRLAGTVPAGLTVWTMPSTSPAYTLSFDKKLEAWRVGIERNESK